MSADFDLNNMLPELGKDSVEYMERPIAEKVFLFCLSIALILGLLVFSRITFLNVVKAEHYSARSEGNANKEIAIPAFRGLITDRYGEILAKNAETFSVFLNLSELFKDEAKFESTIMELSKTLSVPISTLKEALQKSNLNNSSIIPVQRNISTQQAIALKGRELDGVLVLNDYRREYIDGRIFSHIIGYTGIAEEGNNIVGKTGLEKVYNDKLTGIEGLSIQYRDVSGSIIDERIENTAVPGNTLESTIDADLQREFYESMQNNLANLNRDGGVAMAMDPRSGEILALVSLPDYDNNVFVTPSRSDEISEIFADTRQPLFNRAVSGVYNPASTIKTLVGLAALREEVVDDVFGVNSKGYIEIPNPYNPDNPSRFLDWKAHGWVNIRSALARSSNVYFYVAGGGFEDLVGLGIKRLREYWQYFKLGEQTGIDLAFEAEGNLPSPEEKEERTGQPWRIGDTYNISIGQGDLRVTPIQLLRFIASIAADGKMYKPTLTRKITDPNEKTIYQHQIEQVLDYSDWDFELTEVQAGMAHAVTKDYGTAHLLANLPISVAAKTGSAQVQNNTKTNAFFVGYAPVKNPEIVILILVEDAVEGSLNTVPVARDIFTWYYENRVKNPDVETER
ncbi:MAG: penicillin-binding protein 2 [bacterium]|nr:penicillin-binding protein 2 [bacterium]